MKTMKNDWEKIALKLALALDELMKVEGGEPAEDLFGIDPVSEAVWNQAKKALSAYHSISKSKKP